MKKINLDKLSLNELKQLEKDVAKAIVNYEKRVRAEALAKVEKAAKEAGFSLSELVGKHSSNKPKGIAKYKHPENPSVTWTGKGRKPKWIIEALDAGKSLDELAI